MSAIRYILDRLREPGTLRSLVWTIMSLAGYQVTDDAMAQWMLLATAGLGIASAAMPEGRKPAEAPKQ